jgi:hypothetical protein
VSPFRPFSMLVLRSIEYSGRQLDRCGEQNGMAPLSAILVEGESKRVELQTFEGI